MNTQHLVKLLEARLPSVVFFNNAIDKSKDRCVGVYLRGREAPYIALGGLSNTSYGVKSFTILVHWSQDSNECESKAQEIYDSLFGLGITIVDGVKLTSIKMLDSSPVDLSRTDTNICEMAIRVTITYERS